MAFGSVLITGASTGIGEGTAHHLKEVGFDVVGAVRRPEDAERLRSAGLRTVMLEVTDLESIAAAGAALGDGPLAGLVNNAGIAVAGPLEFLPLEQLRRQLEVNLIGQVAVIQRFLASLRAGRGRIVNVSSIGGRVALPLLGAYSMSKFGLEGMSDSLRRELRPQGVDVVVRCAASGNREHRTSAGHRAARGGRDHRSRAHGQAPARPLRRRQGRETARADGGGAARSGDGPAHRASVAPLACGPAGPSPP